MSQVVQSKVLDRIYGKGRGWVFTPKRFLDLGSRDAVDQALFRLSQQGTIRKLSRGLYDYPKQHPQLGLLNPDPDSVAKAISEKDEIRLQPSGAFAVNRLGLSQQVPAKMVYLTDGAEKSVMVGNQTIQLRRTTPKNMATAGSISGLVIQAFRYLGKEGITSEPHRDASPGAFRRMIASGCRGTEFMRRPGCIAILQRLARAERWTLLRACLPSTEKHIFERPRLAWASRRTSLKKISGSAGR